MAFYHIARFIVNIVFRIIFRINIKGRENIPQDGRLIICSNHISLLDPIMVAIAVPRPISFMAKKELFENKLLGKLVTSLNAFPVDREGSDLSAIRNSLKVLKEEKILGIFPEGTRVDKMDLESTKSGIGLIAIKGKAPVVPIYIDSKYRLFSKVNITIGETLSFENLYGEKLNSEDYGYISKEIMKSIYSLKEK
ncbi:MAG: 1-acyl-sn-glycerol-3-phosphate acyltransferase [Tissierellia bacterium]|nr:1-acyl-sn-glycerol-3-phosphate acyltransferase [Tissierellia bacterium]